MLPFGSVIPFVDPPFWVQKTQSAGFPSSSGVACVWMCRCFLSVSGNEMKKAETVSDRIPALSVLRSHTGFSGILFAPAAHWAFPPGDWAEKNRVSTRSRCSVYMGIRLMIPESDNAQDRLRMTGFLAVPSGRPSSMQLCVRFRQSESCLANLPFHRPEPMRSCVFFQPDAVLRTLSVPTSALCSVYRNRFVLSTHLPCFCKFSCNFNKHWQLSGFVVSIDRIVPISRTNIRPPNISQPNREKNRRRSTLRLSPSSVSENARDRL